MLKISQIEGLQEYIDTLANDGEFLSNNEEESGE